MGHKRVFNIITSQCINGQWGIADIAFSITSKEKALLANGYYQPPHSKR